jgi:hypothetical protein
MQDTKGHKHTLGICTTFCSSTATMVAWTCLIVTLYVHCLSLLSDTSIRLYYLPVIFVIHSVLTTLLPPRTYTEALWC